MTEDEDDGESSSTSLSWSFDGKASCPGSRKEESEAGYRDYLDDGSITYGGTSNEEVLSGPRRRRAVDYRKLHDEMFGKDAAVYEQFSEDEDWGPGKERKRKKETVADSTRATIVEDVEKMANLETAEGMVKLFPEDKERRLIFRFSQEAVERLRQIFAENKLPSKSVKEDLSKELGLGPEKISKWFQNAHYLALKSRKTENTNKAQGSAEPEDESVVERTDKKIVEANASENTLTERNRRQTNEPTRIQKSIDVCSSPKKNQHAGESSISPTTVNK